jgi:hypothetical protein
MSASEQGNRLQRVAGQPSLLPLEEWPQRVDAIVGPEVMSDHAGC